MVWLIQRGSSCIAYVWALADLCVCVRVHTSLKDVCEKASHGVLNLQGAQTFHGQPKVFICHKCAIYVPVSSTIMKTVWIGCSRNRVIQRVEKDWSLAGKENQGVKRSLSRGDNLHHSRSLYLSNLDKITCRKAVFFFFVLILIILLSALVHWWHKDYFS